ncbi:MAG TPA: phage holin [Candidatus Monoglobus merdigallinarum]|uniref:Phage holin n=1 Tax=Candidatus Monoglobus merdigallinarum TaxID=2838698 RepID=A0A9D1PQ48_9FIRM|nr:phage holin [Candidatus Monoglobus merdigallinarum]
MKLNIGTISRTLILILALINQVLAMNGKQIINIGDEDIYQTVSLIFTAAASIVSWWKNNSFTKCAAEADEYMKKLKELEAEKSKEK